MSREQIQFIGRSLVLGTAKVSDLPKLGEILLKCAASAEQQPAPDVAGLVEALEGIMRVEARDRVMPVGAEWDAARAALAAHRSKGGGEEQ